LDVAVEYRGESRAEGQDAEDARRHDLQVRPTARRAVLIEVNNYRVGGWLVATSGKALKVRAETFLCVARDISPGSQRPFGTLHNHQGVGESDEHVGDRIDIGGAVSGGCCKTLEPCDDQGYGCIHHPTGRARQQGQLLGGFTVELPLGEGVTLHGPDCVGKGGQRLVCECDAGPLCIIERGVEEGHEFADDGGFEQVVFAGPAPVNRHVRYARIVRDEFNCGPLHAEVLKYPDRAIEDLRPGRVGLLG
jgi:hypothetical protein